MCGIAAILTTNSVRKSEYLGKCLDLLRHRGPNASASWSDSEVGLAHTRLSILDISNAGAQPMVSANGQFVMVYNGEVYNHLDLRKRFLPSFNFVGHSDTETILELFCQMRERILEHLIGMWSLIIWDKGENKLFFSRDRFGQKPLYLKRRSNTLLLSSEIKPLLENDSPSVPNALALSEYIGLGNYDHLGEDTFYRDIKQLLPGHYAYCDRSGQQLEMKPFWSITEISYKDRLPFDKVRQKEFRELVFSAVESQLLSDVPVAASLSGGLDSSIIVSCIAALGRTNFPVFTAQFKGSNFDETPYVKAMEKKWGTSIEVCYTAAEELNLKDSLAKTIIEQEEPFGDPSIMAHGFLVSAARQARIPVLLGGQGGDEISLGYSWMSQRAFAYALNQGDVNSFLKFIRRNNSGLKSGLRMMLAATLPSVEHKLRMRLRHRHKRNLTELLQMPSPVGSFGKMNHFTGIYLESVQTVGIPHLCHYDDRSTMAQSIEGRMPFLDHRLIDFVSQLRPDAFYANGISKSIFRETFSDLLPKEIYQRKDKIGFHTPIADLVLRDKEWVIKLLQDDATSQWVEPPYLKYLIRVLNNSSVDVQLATFIFRIISANIWYKNFISCNQ